MSLDTILSNNSLIIKLFHQLIFYFYFTKPVTKHMAEFILASANSSFSGKLCNISNLSYSSKHRTSVGHFLSTTSWQSSTLWNCIQKFVAKNICDLSVKNDAPVFDDTIVVKSKPSSRAKQPTAATGFHFSHLESKVVFGHQILSCMLSCANVTLPFFLQLYQKSSDKSSTSKIDMVCQIAQLLPSGVTHKAYALCDSWFTCKKVIKSLACRNYDLIGALKTNRIIYPTKSTLGIPVKDFAKTLTQSDVNLVTVGKKSYWVYRYQGKLNDIKEAAVIISWPKEAFGKPEAMSCFLSTDITIDFESIFKQFRKTS